MKISITEEDILNLKVARIRLLPISDPGTDLEILTIDSIIKRFEQPESEDDFEIITGLNLFPTPGSRPR